MIKYKYVFFYVLMAVVIGAQCQTTSHSGLAAGNQVKTANKLNEQVQNLVLPYQQKKDKTKDQTPTLDAQYHVLKPADSQKKVNHGPKMIDYQDKK